MNIVVLVLISFSDPPPAAKGAPVRHEITSAVTLNELLAEIAKLRTKGATAAGDAIDAATLAKLHTTPEKFPEGNPALLRDDAKIVWPKALANLTPKEDADDARRRIEKAMATARSQAKDASIDAKIARDLKEAVADLDKWFGKRLVEVPQADHAEAKRYLQLLKGASVAAAWPDIKEFRGGGSQCAKGADVAALTDALTSRKLRFAPARPSDDAAYAQVHRKLETYRDRLRVAAP